MVPMIKRFLLYFISISALPGFVFWFFYQSDVKFHENLFESQESAHVNLQSRAIAFHFQNIESDLAIISELHELSKLAKSHEDYSSKELEYDFFSISLRKGIYDQIRFIDKTGQELVRVNYNNGKPIIVPKDQLQNKASRYYFKKTINLNEEKVYVSPLDLNIEKGEVEKPFKPMIRFGTPIFNEQGKKQGVLVLNFMAKFMIDFFNDPRRDSLGQNHLLNPDGYWLSSPNPEDEWGFMLEERKNKAFSNTFPEEWIKIVEEETGQFNTNKGLFTFTTFYPVMETQKLKSILDKTKRVSMSRGKDNLWKIVSFVPQETLYQALREQSKNLENTLFMLYSFLVFLIGTGTFLFVKAGELKRKADVLLHIKTKFIQLSEEITITANEASTADEAIQICLEKVCNYMKWPVGHVYITDSNETLIPSKIWYLKDTLHFKVFREVTEETSFVSGVGLPGRVMATGKPAWITDVTLDPNFPRAKLVKNLGVKAAIGLPVLEGKKVVAVFEFFAEKAIEPDEPTMKALSNLAVQAGRVTERKRAEEAVNNKTELLKLMQEITITANEATTAEEAMQICIERICLFTKWPVGHVYITDSNETLIPSKIWYIENMEHFKVFREVTENTSFDRGFELPGRVLANGKPLWVTDVTKETWFLRAKFAKDIGVKAGFAFPVLEKEKIVAVLEFFSSEVVEPDEPMLEALSILAVQVGRVTERKRAEQYLISSRKQLEEFAFIVSHDLKAPMRAINSLAGWIVEDYKEALDDKGREWMERLMGRTEHMNSLITGILDYSRIGRTKSTKETLNSSKIVSEVIESLEQSENIIIEIESELPEICYDDIQLKQIFQNLIGNAIKHMGKPEGKIIISYRNTNKFHEFCVKDNGIGIEEEHFERIFKIFQRLNKDKGKDSTGIGLALVKKIINNYNGTVWVESKKGEGSAFYFTIPK